MTIDDDLQNPPEEIPKLLEALSDEYDVVYGEPIAKQHGLHRRLATKLVTRMLRVLGGETAPMVSSFRAFRTRLRDGFADYTGPDVSIDGLLTWQTDRFRSVQVRHAERVEGESNYSLPKLVRHALTMITAFSTRPLRLATTLGFFVILFGVVVLVYVIGRTAIEQDSVPGFPFLASIISIFSGTQLFAIGVIGEYLARVHVRVMARPSYAVRARTATHAAAIASGARREGNRAALPAPGVGQRLLGLPGGPRQRRPARPRAGLRGDFMVRGEGIRCTYLLAPADDAGTAEAAESAGFLPVDTRITLERPAEPVSGPPAGLAVREGREGDAGRVAALAAAAHTDTRFHFDPHFPRQRAAELYATWVGRGFHEDSRHLLVAERDERLLGYVLVSDEPRAIDLIAVERSARGQGVGQALLAAAIGERPEEPISVVTQARNVGALRLYQKLGFTITKHRGLVSPVAMSAADTAATERKTAEIPFNRAARAGNEQAYIDQAIEFGPPRRRRPVHPGLQRAAGGVAGLARPAGAFLHRGAGDGRHPRRHRARRRGDHALLHLRLHRERLRPARRACPCSSTSGATRSTSTSRWSRRRSRPRTRAIVPVHYAGVGCEMDPILDIAQRARAAGHRGRRPGPVDASYRGRPPGHDRRTSAR